MQTHSIIERDSWLDVDPSKIMNIRPSGTYTGHKHHHVCPPCPHSTPCPHHCHCCDKNLVDENFVDDTIFVHQENCPICSNDEAQDCCNQQEDDVFEYGTEDIKTISDTNLWTDTQAVNEETDEIVTVQENESEEEELQSLNPEVIQKTVRRVNRGGRRKKIE